MEGQSGYALGAANLGWVEDRPSPSKTAGLTVISCRGCAGGAGMVISGVDARGWCAKVGAMDVAPGIGGVTEGTATPERTRLQIGSRSGHVQGWVEVCSIACCFSSMLCGATRASPFDSTRCVMPICYIRRCADPAKRRADGCQVLLTPGQQGGSRYPPAGGPYQRIVSRRHPTLVISSKRNRINRNPSTPKRMCTTSRKPGHAGGAGDQTECV